MTTTCPHCGGTGWLPQGDAPPCPHCEAGHVAQRRLSKTASYQVGVMRIHMRAFIEELSKDIDRAAAWLSCLLARKG